MQIDESLHRILSQKDLVIERFYGRFLNQHADARKHFADVDMNQQSDMLTIGASILPNSGAMRSTQRRQ